MAQYAVIPVETINRVLNYLASQPYAQVAELISDVQAKAKIQDTDAKPTEAPAQ